MGSAEAVVREWGSFGGPGKLTSVAHDELVEMAQPFQAAVLGVLVWVLAQNPQHAHQLPDPFEVLFWLWRECRTTTDGRTHPRSPHPATGAPQHSPCQNGCPLSHVAGLGLGLGQN